MKCKKLNIINVLMKSLIHIIMDITKYRQHVVNSPYVTNHLNGEPWEEVRMFVPHLCTTYCVLLTTLGKVCTYNHPLVNSHQAYWLNRTTLCLGYRLRNNPDIFRPIFNSNRQREIDRFQNNIKRVVEKRKEKLAFIELFKIKQFPRVLVEKIIKLAY